MHHDLSLISTLAVGFVTALLFGLLAERIKVPALVGYLFAGILIGPATPGFVADTHIASQLSEIGIMLLMFGVGLHFSLRDLLSVKHIALPGALVQMGIATLLGYGFGVWLGWSNITALVFGLSLSCASTVVLLKALEARGILDSNNGRIAVGWLVVEDLATVIILVLLPPLASFWQSSDTTAGSNPAFWQTISYTLLHVAAFVALMLIVGKRVLPWFFWQVSGTGSRELFTLSVIAVAIGIAYGAAMVFSVSFALGAFFAGMVMRESEFSHRAAEESLPLRDAFSVLFFVSVGMLFDPNILIEQPLHVLAVVLIIVVGKSLAAALLTLLLRYPLNTALTVAVSLAQIGEFSFILAGLSKELGLLGAQEMSLILAGALISIALNPLLFKLITPIGTWLLARSAQARQYAEPADPYAMLPSATTPEYLAGQVVLVGFGRVGQRIAAALDEARQPYVVAEENREAIEMLRAKGKAAVVGDARQAEVIIQAHIARAATLVIAIPNILDARQIAHHARLLNPTIRIIFRAHHEDEVRLLRNEGELAVCYGEEALANEMLGYIFKKTTQQNIQQ